ncbi:hypothetical protein ET445_09600 [Agromyces protaetiae]|uniref:PNPLA domain-containing protein n=1 Tax=Agromyces protaetiae TaxID=2509455 RepID=A0A4P6FCL4_9MICO|nr:hypothetical protein [Agromyces protaetiae]QAY73555.1 hypothetical protein ET445_09600 [Agromyces protaetiae]
MTGQSGSAVRSGVPSQAAETARIRALKAAQRTAAEQRVARYTVRKSREGVRIEPRTWRSIGAVLSWIAVAALVGVVLGEIDRLIASVPADGRSHSLNVAISPLAITHVDSWAAWASAPLHDRLGYWITLSAVVDLVLAFALVQLFLRLLHLAGEELRLVPAYAIASYAVFELIENSLQAIAGIAIASGLPTLADAISWPLAFASTGKVLSLVVLIVAFLRIKAYRDAIFGGLRRILQAVWVHRLATLAILVIAVLACIPAADLLDQLPDVQRQWADGFTGFRHAVFAVGALIGTAAGTFALGRRRTRLLVETRVMRLIRMPADDGWDAAWPWVIAPAVLVAVGVGVSLASLTIGLPFPVHLPTAIPLLIVLGAIPVFAGIGWRKAVDTDPEPADPHRARFSWMVGDALAVFVLVAGGIGIVRSYVVPALLADQTPAGASLWPSIVAAVAVVAGGAVAVLAPRFLLPRLGPATFRSLGLDPDSRLHQEPPRLDLDPDDRYVTPVSRVEVPSIIVGVVVLAVFMLFPVPVGAFLGAVAVALASISAWVSILGSFTLLVQPRALVLPFGWLKLKAPPVLTLAILIPFALNLVVSAYFGDETVHAVQVSASRGESADDPNALSSYLDEVQADVACNVAVKGHDPVRPVFLIAAEGGGIRAAYWTASALAALEDCGARSGYVASGISGGSVGLAIASSVDTAIAAELPRHPSEAESRAAEAKASAEIIASARAASGPDVVSSALVGLAVGDLYAGATGIRVPSVTPDPDGDDLGLRWRDRAAIVEALWERDAPALATSFSSTIDRRTGMLMMNSADVVTKCRLLVDQVPVTDRGPKAACDSAGGLPSMLGFRELPLDEEARDADPPVDLSECLTTLDWSTAAMLSARFAVITPTGGMPANAPCNTPEDAQFVDGGYVEPTSLAALADTAPELMALLAKQNEQRAEGEGWLVPVLLYLRNTQGYDLAKDVARAESEALVPITGSAARTNLTAEDSWLQRIVLSLPSACPSEPADAVGCRAALARFFGTDDSGLPGILDDGMVEIAPASTPAVVPPLGWALSQLSQSRFDSAIATAAGCTAMGESVRRDASVDAAEPPVETADDGEAPPDATAGYPGLAKLGEVMGFDPCAAIANRSRAAAGAGG